MLVSTTINHETIKFLVYCRLLHGTHRTYLEMLPFLSTIVFLSAADEDGLDCADADLYSEASSVMTGSRVGSKYSHSNSRISS